jgi:hypothetical protein
MRYIILDDSICLAGGSSSGAAESIPTIQLTLDYSTDNILQNNIQTIEITDFLRFCTIRLE